jgi:hypothetical protein
LDEGLSVAACSKQLQHLANASLIAGESILADTLVRTAKAWCQRHVELYGTNAVTALKTVLAATPGESTPAVPLRWSLGELAQHIGERVKGANVQVKDVRRILALLYEAHSVALTRDGPSTVEAAADAMCLAFGARAFRHVEKSWTLAAEVQEPLTWARLFGYCRQEDEQGEYGYCKVGENV